MRDSEDLPPSYEDVVTGGDPPKYSSVVRQKEEEIRVYPNVTTNQTSGRAPQSATTNQTTGRAPHSVPGRAPRGKWYGKHHLVPSSTPTRTMCQREASQDAMRSHRLWMQQEGSLDQLNSHPVPNKEFSNCCLIIIMAAVVISLLALLQPWGELYTSYSEFSQDRVSQGLGDKRPVMPTQKPTPEYVMPQCKPSDCLGDAPNIKDATFVPELRPQKCGKVFTDMNPVPFFRHGDRFSVKCPSTKVLSISPSFFDVDYTGRMVRKLELKCSRKGWVYRLNHREKFIIWSSRPLNTTKTYLNFKKSQFPNSQKQLNYTTESNVQGETSKEENSFHVGTSKEDDSFLVETFKEHDSVVVKPSKKDKSARVKVSDEHKSLHVKYSSKEDSIHREHPIECITETELIKRRIG